MSREPHNGWSISDSSKLYNLPGWSNGYFALNERGHVVVHPRGPEEGSIDLPELVSELSERGLELPLLIRFGELVQARLREIHGAFANARREFEYPGEYRGVYPIKVNQDRLLVERLVDFGRPFHFGLEAGSKPELLAVMAWLDDPEALVICNGYKDEEYVELGLLARRLGPRVVLVVEKPSEVELIARVARRTGLEPSIGLRARLSSRGSGHWQDSAGERSKFGLSGRELVAAVSRLGELDLLGCCHLLHYHIGSQIASIQAVKDAIREAAWVYVNLARLGAPMGYLDVGGGLGVDYDGTRRSVSSSMNYSLQEYANDVVYGVQEICEPAGVSAPTLVTEAGRATVAHHAVLVVDVLGTGGSDDDGELEPPADDAEPNVRSLWDTYREVGTRGIVETYHDAVTYREQCLQLFRLGRLTLVDRALAEEIFERIGARLRAALADAEAPPEELRDLESGLAETYFCNFSLFQSVPDSWAIDQIFPIVPLTGHDRRPSQRAVLADITCDSDGAIRSFVGPQGAVDTLPVQPFEGRSYPIGIFLVGAYQESLGDLHNLFGDSNSVVVSLDEKSGYTIDEVSEGDTVTEVLEDVHYDRRDLVRRVRRFAERALKDGLMKRQESRDLLRLYEEGLAGYTYLEGV